MNKKNIVTVIVSVLIVVTVIFGSDIKKTESGSGKNRIEAETRKNDSKEVRKNDIRKTDYSSDNKPASSPEEKQPEKDSDSGRHKDGTYNGTGNGYKGEIKVQVTVSEGKITSINIVESNDDPEYFNRAKNITDDMVKNQTADVDTVSGATISSNGIIDSVNNALESAVK